MRLLFCSIFFFSFISNAQFSQVGTDIDGLTGDGSGNSVSLNADGTVLVVGSSSYSVMSSYGIGKVLIYKYNGIDWLQLGQTLYGEFGNDFFGNSVSINDAGNRICIGVVGKSGLGGTQDGEVRVYDFDGTSWGLVGAVLVSASLNSRLGTSVDISGGGNRIVVCASGDGEAFVFEFNGTNWIQIGQTMSGMSPFVTSVAIDSGGNYVVLGGEGGVGSFGVSRIFHYSLGNWLQIGGDLIGDEIGDAFGKAVTLSTDASVVCVSSPNYGVQYAGKVSSFSFFSSTWNSFSPIIGNGPTDNLGGFESVSLDDNGEWLIVSSFSSDGGGVDSGHASVYKIISNSWQQVGNNILGEYAGDGLNAVSISSDGTRFALGSKFNDDGGLNAGHVRVYDIGKLSLLDNLQEEIYIFPNPIENVFRIESEYEIVSADIYDVYGKFVVSFSKDDELVLNIKSGVYFFYLKNVVGTEFVKKIIKS